MSQWDQVLTQSMSRTAFKVPMCVGAKLPNSLLIGLLLTGYVVIVTIRDMQSAFFVGWLKA